MSLLIIVRPILMNFLKHSGFTKEVKPIQKKHKSTSGGIESLELLLGQQFDPTNPVEVIGPAKINRISDSATVEIWKVEMAVPKSGLRPSQWPRVWFAVQGENIAFLEIALHIDGYDDSECERIARSRATDIF